MTGRVLFVVCCIAHFLVTSAYNENFDVFRDRLFETDESICTSTGEWISVDQFEARDSPVNLCKYACRIRKMPFAALQRMESDMENVECFCGNSEPIPSVEGCSYFCGDGACGGRNGMKSVYPACPKGYYGTDCRETCSSLCLNRECHFITGECLSCREGYRGPRCDEQCHCLETNGISCNMNSSLCEAGCKNGYYSTDCSKSCPYRCRDRTCDQHTGLCTKGCTYGYYSVNCSKSCSYRCLDNECHNETGACLKGCTDGWYSENCTRRCPPNCDDGVCDQKTGMCSKGCRDNTYGEKCNKSCSSSNCKYGRVCDMMTGECTEGCEEGWFLPNCTQRCSEYCGENDYRYTRDSCRQSDGRCNHGCRYDYFGDQCTEKCPAHCSGRCDQKSGLCTQGCEGGWYSINCTRRCPNNCQYNCDFLTGDCIECDRGWYGDRCEELCPSYCLNGCEKDYEYYYGALDGPCKKVSLPIWLLAVAVISALLLGVIVTAIPCGIRRCKHKKKQKKVVETISASTSDLNDDRLLGQSTENLIA